jgi:magnesium transporter
MITAYTLDAGAIVEVRCSTEMRIPEMALWVDLASPSPEERALAEAWIGTDIPTREEMAAIETSERLYESGGALVMTAVMPLVARNPDPKTASMTLVVTKERFVSLRHGEPVSIAIAVRRIQSESIPVRGATDILFVLLDAIADRAADVVEECSSAFDATASGVFERGIDSRKSAQYKATIQQIGLIGLKIARMHDACASLERLFLFLSLHAKTIALNGQQKSAAKALGRDIRSIREHATGLDARLNFLLDATVGLVNLEQNQIIKIFSVLAVVFLPPTLIASIYGMNFEIMPELAWPWGYPFSLGIMVVSVALTFLYFRWKKLL